MERLGELSQEREHEPELSQAFRKFSRITYDLASLMKQLVCDRLYSFHDIFVLQKSTYLLYLMSFSLASFMSC